MRNSYAYRAARVIAIAMVMLAGVALLLNESGRHALAQSAADATIDDAPAMVDGPGLTRVSLAEPTFGPNVMAEIAPLRHNPPRDAEAIANVGVAQPIGSAIAPAIGSGEAQSLSTRATDCCVVGDFEDAFGFDRFTIGNVFTTTNGETVTEVRVELDFTSAQTEAITYMIYRFNRATGLYEPALIKKVNHLGQGQKFYSSGPISLTLSADLDMMGEIIPAFYFVGVGWDTDVVQFIVWGRDDDPGGYPTLGCFNSIEGSFGSTNAPPPVGSTTPVNFAPLFRNGVTSLQLCSQAPGGACCQPNGDCVNDVTGTDCTDVLGGSYFGDFTLCELENCEGIGACCLGVSCQDLTESECSIMGGTYKGDGSDCSFIPDPCDTTADGACCRYDGDCEEVSEYDCEHDPRLNTPGNFSAPGVECTAANCQPQGACCDAFNNCNDTTANLCTGVLCVDTDPMGACPAGYMIASTGVCPPGGNPGECFQPKWNQGEPCEHNACFTPFSVGACCLLGECSVGTKLACENQGGVFTAQGVDGWQACSTNGFPGLCATSNGFDRGACCLPTGCEIRDPASCTGAGGTFQGAQVECTDFICSEGACCWDNMGSNACADVVPLECTGPSGLPSGVFQGPDTSCPFAGCNIGMGACCGIDGSCDDVSSSGCDESAGLNIFQGPGTNCATASCQPMGACCGVDGSCSDGTPSSCNEASGLFFFQGVGTTCMSLSCPDTGACCKVDGTCTDVAQSSCDEASGFFNFQGFTTACVDEDCPITGACCTQFGCLEVGQQDCINNMGSYAGDGTICFGQGDCDPGVCCLVDLDVMSNALCIETTRVDCAFEPGGLFNDSVTSCGIGTCPVRGACCTSSGCKELTTGQCATSNGTYIGDGQLCETGTCQPAACCNGTTCTDTFPDLCQGTVGNPGQLCASGNLCTDAACCADFFSNGSLLCGSVNQLECQEVGGSFGGIGSTCSGSPCALGACCANDGMCDDNVTKLGCLAQGNSHSLGQTCAQVACVDQTTGACCSITGTCQNGVDSAGCAASGGAFNAGQTCAQVSCVDQCAGFSGIRLADFDGDADVDLVDFAEFQICFGSSPSLECRCMFDANLDGLIDEADYSAFEVVFTGILPPTGRCCHMDGTCDANVQQADCDAFGTAMFTLGGVCAPNTCINSCLGYPGNAPGDYDGDTDVDLIDFTLFEQCMGSTPSDECMCVFDADEDGDVDIGADYSAFDASVTGPN